MPCCFRTKRWFSEYAPGCQFDVSEDRLVAFGGQTYCPLHLPMAGADGTPSPKAAWSEEQIEAFNAEVFAIIDAVRDANIRGEPDEADLSGVVFPGEINFGVYDADRPLPTISFGAAEFSSKAEFGGATFSGHAYFAQATFSGHAYFVWATFLRRADFARATFAGGTIFVGATFKGVADFSGGAEEFGAPERRYTLEWTGAPGDEDGSVACVGAATQPARPSASVFQLVDFAGAEFGVDISFNNRRFTDITNFRDAVFGKAPKFHNAVLHQDTDFTGARFEDFASDDAARNYRTLKLAMEQVRARQEEAMFFALEQRSLRNQSETPWTGKLASAFYEWAAEYGQSFVRPVLWLLAFTIIFAGVYATVMLEARDLHSVAFAPCPFDYLTFTLKQTFRPFEIWSSRPYLIEPFECYGLVGPPLLLRLLATLQSLFTFGMLTLFLLALRKRFRMI